MVFNQGLVGPKAKPKGAADGQPVNIPALGCISILLRNVLILAHYGFGFLCVAHEIQNVNLKSQSES